MEKHYLYKHIRTDTNEVFYIGIGTRRNKNSNFLRAYSNESRNNWWHKIVNKTDYEVKIIEESNNYEYIKNREKELIKYYGRRDLNEGTLVNLTNGGDGTIGYIFTEEHIENISGENNFWYNKIGKDHSLSKSVIQICPKNKEIINNFVSVREASRKTDIPSDQISGVCNNKRNTSRGYIWIFKSNFDGINNINWEEYKDSREKPVLQFDLNGDFIAEYSSSVRAENETGISRTGISDNCLDKMNKCGNYIWRFKYDEEGNEFNINSLNPENFITKSGSKNVIKYDLNFNKLEKYNSISEASRKTGFNRKKISKSCKNKEKFKDYYWSFKYNE